MYDSRKEQKCVSTFCSKCGEKFDCDEITANGAGPVLCDDCDIEHHGTWHPDPVYRSQYDYACGYHD